MKITKPEAIKILISDFHTLQLQKGYEKIADINDELDREIFKALKLTFPKGGIK